ncbi:MAG: hypothetical protein VSS75_004485 [Candidatus Parabeggiatoa sp.]|nr:hypothetical protein [Candidatus Parabeggiatoa sp.]
MKSEELSDILHGLNEVLKLYPGKDIGFILRDLKRSKENENKESILHKEPKEITKKKARDNAIDEGQKVRIDKLHETIDSLSLSEIEKKLNSEDLFPNMPYIRYFAKKLGVKLASRLNKANSIHTIKNHLDHMRIDRTISKRNE